MIHILVHIYHLCIVVERRKQFLLIRCILIEQRLPLEIHFEKMFLTWPSLILMERVVQTKNDSKFYIAFFNRKLNGTYK